MGGRWVCPLRSLPHELRLVWRAPAWADVRGALSPVTPGQAGAGGDGQSFSLPVCSSLGSAWGQAHTVPFSRNVGAYRRLTPMTFLSPPQGQLPRRPGRRPLAKAFVSAKRKHPSGIVVHQQLGALVMQCCFVPGVTGGRPSVSRDHYWTPTRSRSRGMGGVEELSQWLWSVQGCLPDCSVGRLRGTPLPGGPERAGKASWEEVFES